ncbi:unnamed protein product [Darwinula stevensoni]|uniref:RING-type domain-containing protein n=1 Tax=Darwinula stevensoni TaxID=69355 RepID=A0A7R8XHB8_9CRUS|nr:unnamed protein product [Darwinula stevensoni]CAG0892613.1 unnamed protein product [Darwinula stevensoni]
MWFSNSKVSHSANYGKLLYLEQSVLQMGFKQELVKQAIHHCMGCDQHTLGVENLVDYMISLEERQPDVTELKQNYHSTQEANYRSHDEAMTIVTKSSSMSTTTMSTAMDPGTSRGSRGSLEKGDHLAKKSTKARIRENVVNAPPKKLKKKESTEGRRKRVGEESSSESFLCKVCLEEEMGIVFQPCGHLMTCPKCASSLTTCPPCKDDVHRGSFANFTSKLQFDRGRLVGMMVAGDGPKDFFEDCVPACNPAGTARIYILKYQSSLGVVMRGRPDPRCRSWESLVNCVQTMTQWSLLACLFTLLAGQGISLNRGTRVGGLGGLSQGLLPDLDRPSVSPLCRNHTSFFLQDLNSGNASTWSLLMADASGKIPAGYLKGNVFSVGNFDECLKVSVNFDDGYRFLGKHCLAQIFAATEGRKTLDVHQRWNALGPKSAELSAGFGGNPLLTIGFCIPNSCSSDDLKVSLDETLANFSLSSQIMSCDDSVRDPLSSAEIGVTILLVLLAVYMASGTALDIFQQTSGAKKFEGKAARALLAGSIYTNGKKLLSTNAGKDNIGCLSGIRFLTITWVAMGHVLSLKLLYTPSVNPMAALEVSKDWKLTTITNGTVSVDTFLLLSGLLVTYLLLKELERNKGRFNILRFYLHRYLRLTPALALWIGFTTAFIDRFASGPFYLFIRFLTDPCKDYWWRNVLYVNNFFKQEELCSLPTWYLANDMQMYIVSPLFIVPLYFWPITGVVVLVVSLALNALATVLVLKRYDLFGTEYGYVIANPLGNSDNFNLYYVKPWIRLGPYLVGILTGFLLYKMKKTRFRFPKGAAVWGWAMATACNLAVLYGISDYMALDSGPMPRIPQLAYNALFRIAWACGVAWVILACAAGSGGPVDAILSWKAFIPLGRLTYSVYLTHFYVITWFLWRRQEPE